MYCVDNSYPYPYSYPTGAACISHDLVLAARPFHPNRSGMILGSGGIGIMLESEEGAKRRAALKSVQNKGGVPSAVRPYR
ncbi:hypothetical protein EON63_20520 [archaeon]|nr:MAG: hypothetical protein EON63_20520 [archaeon]